MKKVFMYALLAVLVVGLALSIYFLLNEDEQPLENEIEQDTGITVATLDVGIKEIFLANTEGEFHFIKRDDGWKLIFDEEIPTHGNSILAIESMLAVTMAEELVEEGVKSLGKYGLDNPYAKLRYTTMDGKDGFLHIGNSIASSNHYFTIDNQTVYTMSSSEAVFAFLGMSSFVDLTMVEASLEKIYGVEFRNETEEIHISRKETVDDEGTADALFSFIITKPVNANAAPSSVEALFNNFLQIDAENYLPYADEKDCGISEKGMYFRVKGDGMDETLYLGDTTPDGLRYVKKDGIDGIFCVDDETLSFMHTTTFALVDKHVALYYFDQVSSIEINSSEESYVLEFGDQYLINGSEITIETAQDFFQSLISLTYDDIVTDEDKVGEGKITITFNMNSGTDKIVYSEYDAMSYAVSKKGVSGFTIKKKYVDKIINLVKGLA